jgi:methylenetetrahydrofolate dehydrogenase (NADP+)/methenyltetrahydrofolate cyclohydrolase
MQIIKNCGARNVLVVGRSKLLGRPLIDMLIDSDFNVMVAHSKTSYVSMRKMMEVADIIIFATGADMSEYKDYVVRDKFVIDPGNSLGDIVRKDYYEYHDMKEIGALTVERMLDNLGE